jgi:hypothetical protein
MTLLARLWHPVQGPERPVESGGLVLRALCAPGSDRLYARAGSTRAYGRARLALFSPTSSLIKEYRQR